MASKGGYRPGSGNVGHAKQDYIRQEVRRLSERWFQLSEQWLNGKDKGLKKLAFTELGKLVGKSMPTEFTGEDGGPLQIKIINYADSNYIVPTGGPTYSGVNNSTQVHA